MGKPTLKVLVVILAIVVFLGFFLMLVLYAGESVGEKQADTQQETMAETSSETLKEGISGPDSPETAEETEDRRKEANSSEYLVLVNKTHGLGKAYEPEDLKTAKPVAHDRPGEYQMLRKTAAKAFFRLSKGAKKQGYVIKLTTGFRPYDYQKTLYRQYIRADGKKKAEQYSAKPGYSEHQTGLCADVSSPSVEYELTRSYGKTKEGRWLAKNAHRYGFIIRYPKDREDITGYEYEPWHIRYVGKDAAKEIYEQGVTLEEYLGEI